MKINAKFFNYYIIHPFSTKLSASYRPIAAIVSAIFFFLTFGILHGRAYLIGRKVKQQPPNSRVPKPNISEQAPPAPKTPETPAFVPVTPKPRNPEQVHPLRLQFEAQINKMRNHIFPYQRQTLLSLFERAIQSDDPHSAMNQGIDAKINAPDGWGSDKATFLKKDLLPILERRQIDGSLPLISDTPVGKIAKMPIDAQGNKLVCFYKTGPTEFLGNFAKAPHGVNVWGHHFQCSEAAFQWRKYDLASINDPQMNEFFQADGEKAFQLNRHFEKTYPNRFASGWRNGVRDQVMWEVLEAKFSQNQEFKRLLDETKGAYLLEHNQASRDNYWSDNHDGSGKNMLGKMLMALRDGHPKPPVDDTSDASQVRYFATYANRSLGYSIF